MGLHFDVENLKIASIYHKQADLLWRARNLFSLEPDFWENIFYNYLPEDNRDDVIEELKEGIQNLIHFMVYRLMTNSEDYLYSDRRLFMFTLYEMFQRPFELTTYFLNDCEYMAGVFNIKYSERRLYLLDSLDNLALKSLNIFKEKESLEKVAEKKGTDEHLKSKIKDFLLLL